MQREVNIFEPMNLKPMYVLNLSAAESLPSRGMTSIREHNAVEARVVGGSLNSQSRAITEKARHQHLFSSSVCEWGKNHFYGWHHRIVLSSVCVNERAEPHRVLTLNIPVSSTHLSNYLLKGSQGCSVSLEV
ncbi:uncharacterized protein TNCV_4377991 [Trichonephila clavipes]|nr:uncharacterized protein TNCV_4377991 [Trichonephila clavipes]